MKVRGKDSLGRETHWMTLREAVKHEMTPSPYSYSGQLERTEQFVENIISFQCTLIEMLAEKHLLSADDIRRLFGNEWEMSRE